MNPDGSILPSLLSLLFCAVLTAFLTVGKSALDACSESTIKNFGEADPALSGKAEKALSMMERSDRILPAARLGITLCSVFAAAILTLCFAPIFTVSVPMLVLACLGLGCILFLFGRLVPYRLAVRAPEKTLLSVLPVFSLCITLLTPFRIILSVISGICLRLFGIDPNQPAEQVTEEEIRSMVEESSESGGIEQSEMEMINNIFEFDDRTAEEVMTHRTEMIAVPVDATLPEVIDHAVEEGCSRIPVYEDDIDNIIGVLYVKDLLQFVTKPPAEFNIRKHMRSALFVPETTRCEDLMQQLKTKKLQMAIVVDEYGGTSGLVTMEDLIESIFGSIQDEYDDEEELITKTSESSYLINGITTLEEVEKLFDIKFPEETEYDTLGGFITEQLDHIPADDEKAQVKCEDILFTVISIEDRRIAKVRAEKLTPAPIEE